MSVIINDDQTQITGTVIFFLRVQIKKLIQSYTRTIIHSGIYLPNLSKRAVAQSAGGGL